MQNKQGTGNTHQLRGLYKPQTTTGDEGYKNNNASIDNKQDTNGHNCPGDMDISINYFHSSNNVDADKRSNIAMMQRIHTKFGNVLMA